MSLVTWQAIGAVVLLSFPALACVLAIYKGSRTTSEEMQLGCVGVLLVSTFWFICILILVWELIGVGLFGVTR